MIRRPTTWRMDDGEWPYLDPTDGNERDIEMPWGRQLLARARGQVLEVGNCTQRFWPKPQRDIVCQYDRLGGPQEVHREDICRWRPGYDYNLILSLSTLEHIGKEYEPDDDAKAIVAVEHCISLLRPNGRMAFSIPTGFHGSLERWVINNRARWQSIMLMVRISAGNEWEQRPLQQEACGYPGKWGGAGAVLFVKYVATRRRNWWTCAHCALPNALETKACGKCGREVPIAA